MEAGKSYFAFFTIVLSLKGTETAGYGVDRIRQDFRFLKSEMNYIREDISALFNRTDQLKISAIEGCGPCVSGTTHVMQHDGRQDIVKLNVNNMLVRYRRLTKAFTTEKKINRDLQHQLRSMEKNFSASEKVANKRYTELLSRLQSMEDSISSANERERELRSYLRSMEESVEDKISNTYRDLRNDMISFTTTVSKSETTSVKSDITTSPMISTFCKTVPESGVYTLQQWSCMPPANVYCDQEKDGGGWTVFMRRQDGSVNFTRPWTDYKYGFGTPDGEFWAGNELLYKLTETRPMQLKIVMEDFDGNTTFAKYEEFQIGAETDKYRLHVSGYSGTAGDSLIGTSYPSTKHAGMQFSTFDSDNDNGGYNCAEEWKSGWWFNWCFESNLNAPYSHNKSISLEKGIRWYSWKRESIRRVEMKIR